METKKCLKCNETKNVSEFYPNKTGGKNGYDSYCKKCRYEYHKSRKDIVNSQRRTKMQTDLVYRERELQNKRLSHYNNLEHALLARAKARAIKWNLEFNITVKDIVIPEICPLLEIPIIPGVKNNYLNTPSLDRIDNSKGYTKDNIRVISMLANSMKNSASSELLLKFAKNIPDYINQTKI